MTSRPIESYAEVAERFPGVTELDPQAIGRFAFHTAANFPDELFKVEYEAAHLAESYQDEEPWKKEVFGILYTISNWKEEQKFNPHHCPSRFDLAKSAAERIIINRETKQLSESLKTRGADEGFDAVMDYLDRWEFNVEIRLAASPMFPEGRTKYVPATRFADREARFIGIPYGTKITKSGKDFSELQPLDARIEEYLEKDHPKLRVREKLQSGFDSIRPVDRDALTALRLKFGAKAANLMAYQERLESFYRSVDSEDGVDIVKIPPFSVISTELFDAWSSDDPAYTEVLETLRAEARKLAQDSFGGLVAVRSSAVYSEDGEIHTGAGIYTSAVADPTDSDAFERAVISVFESAASPDALAYQKLCGIDQEKMGLIIQEYVEETGKMISETSAYGYINSRGANNNLIEVHTPEGTLLYDKSKVSEQLFIDRWNASEELLHYRPDHSRDLRYMPSQVITAVYGTAFAEMVFEAPVQVEYAADSRIVQVRPLPKNSFEGESADIEFPQHAQLVTPSKAIGTGDVVLEELSTGDDNSDKEGFVVFWSEYGFTDSYNRQHQGVAALPNKGAVVIVNNSESGHIQTLCQERGLLCFYPENGSEGLVGIDTPDIIHSNIYGYYGSYDEFEEDSPETEPERRRFRFVSNGYDGRIYQAD